MSEKLHSYVQDKAIVKNLELSKYSIVSLPVSCAGCNETVVLKDESETADLLNDSLVKHEIGDEWWIPIYCKVCEDVLDQCKADDEVTALTQELSDPKKLAAIVLKLQKENANKLEQVSGKGDYSNYYNTKNYHPNYHR